jgi:hypothetical protein
VRERSESEWFEEVLLEVVSRAACVGGNGGPGMVDMTESDDKAPPRPGKSSGSSIDEVWGFVEGSEIGGRCRCGGERSTSR